MEDEISELVEETVDALLEARWEICALRELLINHTPIQGHIGDATGLIYYRGERNHLQGRVGLTFGSR